MKENYELINQVNEFYNSAWDKLVIVATVSFAIVGIIVPLLIQWYQKKSLQSSEDRLKNEINAESNKIKEALEIEMRAFLELETKKFEDKIKKLENKFEAGIFHVQGNNELHRKDYKSAFGSLCIAAMFYVRIDDFQNLRAILDDIDHGDWIQNLEKKDIEELNQSNNCDIEKIFDEINAKENKGSFKAIVQSIKKKLKTN